MKFNLGGRGRGGEFTTVNLEENCDIRCDILDVGTYAPTDGSVAEFRLTHTLEHIPGPKYRPFLETLFRKLAPGGGVRVVLTDAEGAIRQWVDGTLSFRAMKRILFPPADFVHQNELMAHHNMWNLTDLALDFQAVGFETYGFDAGTWSFDLTDEFYPEAMKPYHGVAVQNLGLLAVKPK